MFIVAGLGNPEKGYALNRHNFGFMAVDTLAASYGFPLFSSKYDGLVSLGEIGKDKVLLLKPLTFMNLSGNSVGKAVGFYKVPLTNVIVLHDDMDLDFGKIKSKTGGSPAGHNGLKSIDACIGANYARIRLGIGHPKNNGSVSDFVLSNFSKVEQEELPFILGDVATAFPEMIKKGIADSAGFTNALGLLKSKQGL